MPGKRSDKKAEKNRKVQQLNHKRKKTRGKTKKYDLLVVLLFLNIRYMSVTVKVFGI